MKQANFNLDDQDIDIIERENAKLTSPNRSETMRKILREWEYWRLLREQAERPVEKEQKP